MITCRIPARALSRLAKLTYACDQSAPPLHHYRIVPGTETAKREDGSEFKIPEVEAVSAMRNVSIKLYGDKLRFTCTNGSMVAVAVFEGIQGVLSADPYQSAELPDEVDLVVPRGSFYNCMQSMTREHGRSFVTVTFQDHPALIGTGLRAHTSIGFCRNDIVPASALKRARGGTTYLQALETFPDSGKLLRGPDFSGSTWLSPDMGFEHTWIPCQSFLDHKMVEAATKIAGVPIKWVTPVVSTSPLVRYITGQPANSLRHWDLLQYLKQPGYWSDGDVFVMVCAKDRLTPPIESNVAPNVARFVSSGKLAKK